MKLTIKQLAERIGAELSGEGNVKIDGVDAIPTADRTKVTFLSDDKYAKKLKSSNAAAVITSKQIKGFAGTQLIVKNVEVALIATLRIFSPTLQQPIKGIDPTAKIAKTAKVSDEVSIASGVVIADNAEIGSGCVIASGCNIGQNSKLGKHCRLDANVVIYHNCWLGNNVIIQANSTIGSTGFGYSFIDNAHQLIPHNGGVIIEDFVEIGANSCIDRAKFSNTIIGAGTKIDNLVQIAHNVVMGKCCLIAGQVGIAGGAKLGNSVVMGGRSGVSDNVEVGDGVMAGLQTVITNNTLPGKTVLGTPARDIAEQRRILVLNGRLPEMFKQLRQLTKRLDKLEAAEDNKE